MGEGARTWAKSKGINSPGAPKDADEVACPLVLLNKDISLCLFFFPTHSLFLFLDKLLHSLSCTPC